MSAAAAPAVSAERVDADGVLRCRDVSKNFRGVRALDTVTIDVSAGQIAGVIGPNGSGKTTLLNCVSGVLKPDGGSVVVSGEDITACAPYVCAAHGVARTFQNLRLFTNLSVRENLLIGGHSLGSVRRPRERQQSRQRRADELLELLGLAAVADAAAGSLAYGVQRRVEIARAVMGKPTVLLLDEPTAGMNHVEAASIGDICRDLARTGLGLLLVEHNTSLVRAVCEKVFVLDAGREIARGTPDTVLTDPRVVEAYLD